MKKARWHPVPIEPAHLRFARGRTDFLLTAGRQMTLQDLLAHAYLNGIADAVEALDAKGVRP